MKAVTGILAALCVLQGCTIKEDRSPCPSLLTINLEEVREITKPHPVHIWGAGGYHLYEKIIPEEYSGEWTVAVNRDIITVTAACGLDKTEIQDGRIIIGRGQESDRLWTHHSTADCRGEYGSDTLRMHKQYCVLTIDMLDYPYDNTDWSIFPATPEVAGNSCGFDLHDARPISGGFLAYPRYVGEGMFQILLPRQLPEDDLLLRIMQDGVQIGSIDVGTVLHKGGYDWNKTDLDDAFIIVRNSNSISIEDNGFAVAEWEFGGFGTPGW